MLETGSSNNSQFFSQKSKAKDITLCEFETHHKTLVIKMKMVLASKLTYKITGQK